MCYLLFNTWQRCIPIIQNREGMFTHSRGYLLKVRPKWIEIVLYLHPFIQEEGVYARLGTLRTVRNQLGDKRYEENRERITVKLTRNMEIFFSQLDREPRLQCFKKFQPFLILYIFRRNKIMFYVPFHRRYKSIIKCLCVCACAH